MAEAIAPLEDGYAALLARVAAALEGDHRVRALWIAGSVGRGVADAGSDLDLVVTVVEVEAFAEAAVWALVDPVITIPIPGLAGCFAFTTRAGLRVDVVLETPADLAGSAYTRRVCVFDRDGLVVPVPSVEQPGPDITWMHAVVVEFLRQSAIFPAAVVAREDWLLGQVAVHQYRQMLYDLLAESNRPRPETGVKQWSSRLTDAQRSLLAGLPVPEAERDSVVRAMRATRGALRTHGRSALEDAGGVWPVEVDDAMTAYWTRHGLS